ncbi:Protein dennd6b [Thoreauomyces humboldtii]|nr:Protein dennd6b [Thoreauomyces humboldtii]
MSAFGKAPMPAPPPRPFPTADDAVRIESLTSKHKPFLSKDRALIKEVVEAAIRGKPMTVLNNMVRRHFMDLTERFIQPLNKHFQSLVVGNASTMTLSNIRARPEIRPFKQESFLASVDALAASSTNILPVSNKRPLRDLYRAFLLSPNFAAWLQHRTEEVFRDWRRRYLCVLCTHDVTAWARDRLTNGPSASGRNHSAPTGGRRGSAGDVECVDLILRIRDEVVKYAPYFADPAPAQQSPTSSSQRSCSPSPSAAQSPAIQADTRPPRSPSNPLVRPTYIDLSSGADAWASTVCAVAPAPHSPGPVSAMGGVVPTQAQYARLLHQLETLVAVLPDDLRGSIMGVARPPTRSRQ